MDRVGQRLVGPYQHVPKAEALRNRQQPKKVVPGGDDTSPPLADPIGTDPDEPAERSWTQSTGLHELLQALPEVLGGIIADQPKGLPPNRHGATPPGPREGGRVDHRRCRPPPP